MRGAGPYVRRLAQAKAVALLAHAEMSAFGGKADIHRTSHDVRF
jgi:hypothetical protein